MGIGLQLANRNDFVKVEEHINNNLSNLEEMIDNNSGKKVTGYIQDIGEKVLGNYYLDKLTTGLFKCIKSGNINYNSSEYFENDSNYALSDKLKNLFLDTGIKTLISGDLIFKYRRRGYTVTCEVTGGTIGVTDTVGVLPSGFRPLIDIRTTGYFSKNVSSIGDLPTLIIKQDGLVRVGGSSVWAGAKSLQISATYICDNL